ncbi:hypothetical protein [Crocosphaera sp.]|uniref:hypothetical protein n=1 Tax=Crocosphaera sp. TaxID=2729996 RepID=UPI003F29CBEA|nr:hypothetical protein [Crocosphaera sp.]
MINNINEQLSDEQKREKGCIKVDLYFTKKSFDIIANELNNSDQGIPAEGWVKEEFCQVNDYLYLWVSQEYEKFIRGKIIKRINYFVSHLDDYFDPQLGLLLDEVSFIDPLDPFDIVEKND